MTLAGCGAACILVSPNADHPEEGTEESDLWEVSYQEMIEDVSGGPKPQYDRQISVSVLDVAGDIATAKVLSAPFDEYVHLARIEGRWLIVNTLYRRRPEVCSQGE